MIVSTSSHNRLLWLQTHEGGKTSKPGLSLTVPAPGLADWVNGKVINGDVVNEGDLAITPGLPARDDDGEWMRATSRFAFFRQTFFFVISLNWRKLLNSINLFGNFRSKFGCNLILANYGAGTFYGTGPWSFNIQSTINNCSIQIWRCLDLNCGLWYRRRPLWPLFQYRYLLLN